MDRAQRIEVMLLLEDWVERGLPRQVTEAHAHALTGSGRWSQHSAALVSLVEVAIEAVLVRPRPPGPTRGMVNWG